MSRAGTTTRDRTGRSRRSDRRRQAASVTPLPPSGSARAAAPHRTVQLCLAVIALVAVGWLLFAGPLLSSARCRSTGCGSCPPSRCGGRRHRPGHPVAPVDVAAAEARIARLPPIASVEVARGWPDSVVITVVERVPVVDRGPPGSAP